MTVHAHRTRHALTDATRAGGIIDYAPEHSTTFFYELHPHLRNVKAQALVGVDLIYDYLTRRGPRTLHQIADRTGQDLTRCRCLMEAQPERFRYSRGHWEALPQEMAAQESKPPTVAERIAAYLAAHGPATAQEIATALGYGNNYWTVGSVLSRGTSGAVIVGDRGTGRRRSKLWAMNGEENV